MSDELFSDKIDVVMGPAAINPDTDPTQFNKMIAQIGWTRAEIARRLDCDPRLVQMWEKGEREVPKSIFAWIWNIASTLRRWPAPEWKTRDEGPGTRRAKRSVSR